MRCDFLVIGGGILGVTVAGALQRRHSGAHIVLLEKETDLGGHASGRNSGVLHAGFYYDADSLKARFTREGNRLLTEYCLHKGLRINRCGKLVVVRRDAEQPVLDELLRRGQRNGIALEEITEAEARTIEPRVRTRDRALFSPTTSSVDPLEVLRALADDARRDGVDLRLGVRYTGRDGDRIRTSAGTLDPGFVVNAAGLQADRVARDFGFSRRYGILPFKGLYLQMGEPVGALRTHVYPLPDLRNPFLGVHVTVTVDGHGKIGPTAMPAFWREQYHGFDNFAWPEFTEVTSRHLRWMAGSPNLLRLAMQELRKQSHRRMVALAGELVEGVQPNTRRAWGRPGIRAQLVDLESRALVMDFKLEGDAHSLHILNAVSPAFTCCLSFSRYVCEEIDRLSVSGPLPPIASGTSVVPPDAGSQPPRAS